MKKRILFSGLVLLGCVAALKIAHGHLLSPVISPAAVEQITASSRIANVTPANQDTRRFVDYTPERFNQFVTQRRVLYFSAAWCVDCKEADADFEHRTAELPSDVTLFKVNYDQETSLKQKYGITHQHTFVLVDDQGNTQKIWNGGSMDKLLKQLAS